MRIKSTTHLKKWLLGAAMLMLAVNSYAQQYPFQNPELSFKERAKDLISKAYPRRKSGAYVRPVRCYS